MNPNDMVKLKVLQGLKNHMNNSAGQRLAQRVKPKAAPLPEMANGAPTPVKTDPSASQGLPSQLLPDDDKQRLLDLYSKVK